MLITIIVMLGLFGLLLFSRWPADVTFLAAITVLMIAGILTPSQAFVGFSQSVIFTLAALYVVAAALRECGALQFISNLLLGAPRSEINAMARLMVPSAGLSSVMNNTAVVAMFIPVVQQWTKKLGYSSSRFLLPLSYMTILGGMLTIIGTSTNLIVAEVSQSQYNIDFGFFAPAAVAAPILCLAGLYLIFWGRKMLPANNELNSTKDFDRQYRIAMEILPGSNLHGKTILEAGLRHLKHGYLVDIERSGKIITGVSSDTLLQQNDVLKFMGGPECAFDLRNVRGLAIAEAKPNNLVVPTKKRCLSEVVISADFPALGKSIRDSSFRTNYNAVVIAVAHNGERVTGKIGDAILNVGDTLLLESGDDFIKQYQYRKDFLLISRMDDSVPIDHSKAPIALSILAALLLLAVTSLLPISVAAMLAAGSMIATGCISVSNARRSIDLTVLCVVGCAFALGSAITATHIDQIIAKTLFNLTSGSPLLALVGVYILTNVLTELITNNAAAILMLPIAEGMASGLGVNLEPFLVTVMVAASASFLTPIGYQTNLMVQGPGGYSPLDYVKTGLPITVLCALGCIVICPIIWPF